MFSAFGEVKGVYTADESGVRVIVSFADPFSAKSALEALSGRPCPDLDGRTLHIRYSVLQLPSQVGTPSYICAFKVLIFNVGVGFKEKDRTFVSCMCDSVAMSILFQLHLHRFVLLCNVMLMLG